MKTLFSNLYPVNYWYRCRMCCIFVKDITERCGSHRNRINKRDVSGEQQHRYATAATPRNHLVLPHRRTTDSSKRPSCRSAPSASLTMIRMPRPGGSGGPPHMPIASDAEAERHRANRDLAIKIFSFAVIIGVLRAVPHFLES